MQIIFFAASRSQREYFGKLSQHLPCSSTVVWYKSLRWPGGAGLLQLHKAGLDRIVADKVREQRYSRRDVMPDWYWSLYRLIRWLGVAWIFLIYYSYFNRHPCAYIGLWNGNKLRQRIVIAAAAILQRKRIYFENGLLPNTTTLDFRGVNALNSVPREADFYRRLAATTDLSLPTQLHTRAPLPGKQATAEPEPLPEKFIFIPFQVNTDSQITLHSPWLHNMWQLFDAIEAAEKNCLDAQLHFVIKEHPSCPQRYPDLHARTGDRLVFVNQRPTQELIEKSVAVMTINSTVGLEALLLGKKVIVLGDAFYAINGLTLRAASQKDLDSTLNSIAAWRPDDDLRRRFLGYLAGTYAIADSWQHPTERHWQAISERLHCDRQNRPAAFFLVSTPLNLFIATGLALQEQSRMDCHLFFIDQTGIHDNIYIDVLRSWDNSPFRSVNVLPPKAQTLTAKIINRRTGFSQLASAIHEHEPQNIYTGNDRRVEFQYAMHLASQLRSGVKGIYMDDGTYTYVGRSSRGMIETIVDNALKKLTYGSWWQQPPTVGCSRWIQEVYAAFPHLVHPQLKTRKVLPLGTEILSNPGIQELSARILDRIGMDSNCLHGLSHLITLPHYSLITNQAEYSKSLRNLIIQLSGGGNIVGVKYHPRQDTDDPLGLGSIPSVRLIPGKANFEAILPLLQHVTIVGDVSTALLSARWLRPDLNTYSLRMTNLANNEFTRLFARLGIPVIDTPEQLIHKVNAGSVTIA